ncbi:MAG: hypothetical protein L0H70_02695 [Xanthomonadales bacterium]|nr:hypothetical protein [Xanthomonadales bacterium]
MKRPPPNMPVLTTLAGAAAWLLLLLAATSARAAGSDRIFADGFDGCCRIGGTVAGLTGSELVLQLAAGAIAEDRAISGNGLYDFSAAVPSGTSYTLSVTIQPSGQTCTLAITGGTVSGNVDNADVSCGANTKLTWDSGHWGQDWN